LYKAFEMEKIPVKVSHADFEIHVTDGGIKFFKAGQKGGLTIIGSASYEISPDGEVLRIGHGSFTIRPQDLNLGKANIGRLERILLHKAEEAVHNRHKGIKRVIGQIYDTARGASFSAGDLLSLHRNKSGGALRKKLGAGKRPRFMRRR
jgi:hypothetical protein